MSISSPSFPVMDFLAHYKNNAFVADIIAPVFVAESGRLEYPKLNASAAFENTNSKVAQLGLAHVSDFDLDMTAVTLDSYAKISRISRASQRDLELIMKDGALPIIKQMMNSQLLVDREVAVATELTTSGNYATGFKATPGTKWGTATVAQIRADINTACDAIAGVQRADLTMVIGATGFKALAENANVATALQYTTSKMPDADGMSQLFGVKIVEARAQKTDNLSSDSPTTSFIWSDHAVVFKQADPLSANIAPDGFSVTFRQDLGQGYGIYVESWDDPNPGVAGAHLVKVAFREKCVRVAPRYGYLLYDVQA